MKKRTKRTIRLTAALQEKIATLKAERERLCEEVSAIVAAMRAAGMSYEEITEQLNLQRFALVAHPPKRLAYAPELWREELKPWSAPPEETAAHTSDSKTSLPTRLRLVE